MINFQLSAVLRTKIHVFWAGKYTLIIEG